MGVPTSSDFSQRLTPFESSVRSTALAYRFMVRRSLGQHGVGQQASTQVGKIAPQADQTSLLRPRRALQKRIPI